MKTPDEIKKGLGCCNGKWVGDHFLSCCSECPYYSEQPFCKNVRDHDTLAYIQQLETERHQLLTKCERLERERDAAVADLTVIVKSCGESYCEYCEYNDKHYCAGRCWTRNEGFKWRGVKEG